MVNTADVHCRRSLSLTSFRLGLALALAAAVAACGGSSSPEDQAARQLSEALEGIDGLDGVEIDGLDDLIDGDGNFSVESEIGGMAFGTDLPRPDWLPGDFPLPDGAMITAAAIEADDSSAAVWLDVPGTVEQVRADQIAALEAWGARLLTPADEVDDASSLVFATPDGRALRTGYGEIGGRVAVTVEFTADDVDDLEAAVAGPSEGPGSATVVIDADVFTAEGTCQFAPNFASFETASGDTISINLQEDGTGGLTTTVSVTEITADGVQFWLLSDGAGTESSFSAADGTIAARGVFADFASIDLEDGSATELPGSADVNCR